MTPSAGTCHLLWTSFAFRAPGHSSEKMHSYDFPWHSLFPDIATSARLDALKKDMMLWFMNLKQSFFSPLEKRHLGPQDACTMRLRIDTDFFPLVPNGLPALAVWWIAAVWGSLPCFFLKPASRCGLTLYLLLYVYVTLRKQPDHLTVASRDQDLACQSQHCI